MTAPRRALVVIDAQQQYFDGALQIHFPPLPAALDNLTAAIDAANAAGIPVIAVQHNSGEESPLFNPTTPEYALHPAILERETDAWTRIEKRYSSIYPGTGLRELLAERGIDTVTLAGFMTNNCVLASAVNAEELGIDTEVLSDATGAINLANSAGAAPAETVHTTLMTLLNSNWATVTTTAEWTAALTDGAGLERSNLYNSAVDGAQHAGNA